MDNFIGKLLRRVLVVALVLLAIVCRIVAGALTEIAWEMYAPWKDLPPQAIGTVPYADTPRAHSIAEMESLDLFAVEQVQEDGDNGNYVYVGRNNTAYRILTLDSGERVACRYRSDGDGYDAESGRWISPVGRWVPWELGEIERASVEWQDAGLTTLDYYIDMDGTAREEAYSSFQVWFPWVAVPVLWLAIVGMLLLLRLLLWPVREITRPRNDVERWLVTTHALWGYSIAEANRLIPGKRPLPIRFGGLPRTLFTKWELRMVLRRSWNITNYSQLLETVEYMSQGPGFTNCTTQSNRAWQLSRCTALLGMAMVLGWAKRKELVERSLEIGKLIQSHFSSWEELAMGFLEDYSRWCISEGGKDVNEKIRDRVDSYYALRDRSDSPYLLPWALPLDQ